MLERQRQLLATIKALHLELAARPAIPVPPGRRARLRVVREMLLRALERRHGPRIARLKERAAGMNWGLLRRMSRDLEALAAAGLVRLWGQGGRRSHVQLTPAGEEASRSLAERDENICRKDFTRSEAVVAGEPGGHP